MFVLQKVGFVGFVMAPFLPEVVGSELNPSLAVRPVRQMLHGVGCYTLPVTEFDLKARQVVCQHRNGTTERVGYAHLVLAVGMGANIGMIPGMIEHGVSLKLLGDAIFLRNDIHGKLEEAETENDLELRRRRLSIAVVGGGFTGVEVAGAMNSLLRRSTRYYRRVVEDDVRVTLLHSGPRILPPMSEKLSAYAERRMKKAGISVRTGVRVDSASAEGVHLKGGEVIPADTIVSAVGNQIEPLVGASGLELDQHRIVVEGDMHVPGQEGVWALGDCAAVPNAATGSVSPMLAQHALRQAKQLAHNIAARVRGEATKPFHFHDLGLFAMVGHDDAVGQSFGMRVSGRLASLMWHFIYWSKMPTPGRKVQIAVQWFLSLFIAPDIVEIPLRRSHVKREDGE